MCHPGAHSRIMIWESVWKARKNVSQKITLVSQTQPSSNCRGRTLPLFRMQIFIFFKMLNCLFINFFYLYRKTLWRWARHEKASRGVSQRFYQHLWTFKKKGKVDSETQEIVAKCDKVFSAKETNNDKAYERLWRSKNMVAFFIAVFFSRGTGYFIGRRRKHIANKKNSVVE